METEKQRERLVELLKKADENASNKMINDYEDAIKDNADYLMSNNVVVLPCKVGDTVYCIWQYEDFAKKGNPFVKEDVVESFVYDEGKMKPITKGWAEMNDRWYLLKDILYTKEEAENALKEMSNGN